MASVRPAAVAGLFYPGDPKGLRSQVDHLLAAAPQSQIDVAPRLLIVPHAGYVYSGPIAARAYRMLIDRDRPTRRFVVIGPSHFVPFSGLATPGVAAMATPLGEVPADIELISTAEQHTAVAALPEAHSREHSLEVQLPFLQVAVGEFTAALLAVGDVTAAVAADVLGDLIKPGVTGVVSSDLSHYLSYEAARERDERTATAIRRLQAHTISPGDACGRTAVQAALLLAHDRGWSCRQLELANSGDTAGSRDRVVGYGAFVLGPAS